MRYEIKGGSFPVVICELENGEKMVTEKGAMAWMSPNMQMETTGGGLGRMFSKMFSGESMFQNVYTAKGAGMIAFGSCFPGQIKAIEIAPGQEMILQKSGDRRRAGRIRTGRRSAARRGHRQRGGLHGGRADGDSAGARHEEQTAGRRGAVQHAADRPGQGLAANHAHQQHRRVHTALHLDGQQQLTRRQAHSGITSARLRSSVHQKAI